MIQIQNLQVAQPTNFPINARNASIHKLQLRVKLVQILLVANELSHSIA